MKKRPYIPVIPGHIKDADDTRTNVLKALGLEDLPPMDIGSYNDGYNDPPIAAIKIDGEQYSLNSVLKKVGETMADTVVLKEQVGGLTRNAKKYGSCWNKSTAACTRTGDAAEITTTTTNFGHFGSVNNSYSNPFDALYPWSGIRLCNIDLDAYQALEAGDSLLDCVEAWEGDGNFSYDHANGVWRYRPRFWGRAYEDSGSRYFEVTDQPLAGYTEYPEAIEGRWHGRIITLSNKNVLLPLPGMPGKNVAVGTLHTYAKNFGGTIDSIYSIDADALLYLVEYANMNIQAKLGNGVSDLYKQNNDKIKEAATNSSVVKVLKSAASAYCIQGAIFDIGTSNGGHEVGSFIISEVADDQTDDTLLDVTLVDNDGVTAASVTVTTNSYWSIHGKCNTKDADIGSKSGYIGTNGKAIAYYRGKEMYANLWFYVLGAYREKTSCHIWIAENEADADAADALNTSEHLDTGLQLLSSSDYIGALGYLSAKGLNAPPFCTAGGGSSSAPVGDYYYVPAANTDNTVLLVGGIASVGGYCGCFYGAWYYASSASNWSCAARPRLKTPLGG